MKSITLTIKEIIELAEMVGGVFGEAPSDPDELETEVTIYENKEGINVYCEEENSFETYKHTAVLSEYWEEGCTPLGTPIGDTVSVKEIDESVDIMDITYFAEMVQVGCFSPGDGVGYYTTNQFQTDVAVFGGKHDIFNPPKWAVNVVWYNK